MRSRRCLASIAIVALALMLIGVVRRARTEGKPQRTVGTSSLATHPDSPRPSSLPPWTIENALLELLATPDPQRRVAALRAWFRANLPARLAELRAFFTRMHEQSNPDLFTAFQAFLEEWGAIDGAAAYRFAYDSPERSGLDGYAEFAIRGWLRGDFAGLWTFVQSQAPQLASDDDRARWAVTWFTEAFLDTDAARFLGWVDGNFAAMAAPLQREIARTAAFHANDATIERVGEWLQRNSTAAGLGEIVGEFARRYAEMKPQVATTWVTSLADPDQRGAAAIVVARRLAAQDFALGVPWLASESVRQSLGTARAQWRTGEAPASAYDAAVTEFLTTLARHHGDDRRILDAAEASIGAVENAAVRRYLAERLDEVRVTYFGRPVQ